MGSFTIIKDPRVNNAVVGVLFIFLVATISHFLFSHLGLNPTDNGFILAGSRRIIEGQIPHRDFISKRTAGSHFLHIPFVLFGGEYVFLISRYFVWIQFASIAWIWTIVISRSFKVFSALVERFTIALIAFVFSVHYFPIMAWHTVDGLFFVSLGIMFCRNESISAKIVGYMLLGTSPLFKQSFLFMIPITILLFNDWRRLVTWISACIPILVYGAYLAIYGAIPDAIFQLKSHTNIVSVGVIPYTVNLSCPWGIIAGGLAAAYITFDFEQLVKANTFQRLLGFLLLFGIIFSAIWTLIEGSLFGYLEIMIGGLVAYILFKTFNFKRLVNTNVFQRLLGILLIFGIILSATWILANYSIFGYFPAFHLSISFGIFGAAIGIIIFFLAKGQKFTNHLRCGTLVVFVAWCTSLSTGWPSPSLVTGPLILFLMASSQFLYRLVNEDRVSNNSKKLFTRWISSTKNLQIIINLLIILSAVSSLVAFGIARQNYIYREQSASNLMYDLGDVLPGAKGIKTNKNTYDFFKDLQNAKSIVKEKGKKYCIIPDTAANWVKDPQSNPLPSDWPVEGELKNSLFRVINDLEKMRGTTIVIVQKYNAASLHTGFDPISDSYAIVNYVRSNFDWIGETQYFELYE